jgi:hypothetical protein
MELFDSLPEDVRIIVSNFAIHLEDILELYKCYYFREDIDSLIRRLIREDRKWHQEAFNIDLEPTHTRTARGEIYFPSCPNTGRK